MPDQLPPVRSHHPRLPRFSLGELFFITSCCALGFWAVRAATVQQSDGALGDRGRSPYELPFTLLVAGLAVGVSIAYPILLAREYLLRGRRTRITKAEALGLVPLASFCGTVAFLMALSPRSPSAPVVAFAVFLLVAVQLVLPIIGGPVIAHLVEFGPARPTDMLGAGVAIAWGATAFVIVFEPVIQAFF